MFVVFDYLRDAVNIWCMDMTVHIEQVNYKMNQLCIVWMEIYMCWTLLVNPFAPKCTMARTSGRISLAALY